MFNIFSFGKQSNTNLKELLQSNPQLIDVRTPAEFSGGSAKGAINIPLNSLPAELKNLDKDTAIVVFCQSGGRSSSAQQILQAAGFTHVTNGGGVSAVIKAQQ